MEHGLTTCPLVAEIEGEEDVDAVPAAPRHNLRRKVGVASGVLLLVGAAACAACLATPGLTDGADANALVGLAADKAKKEKKAKTPALCSGDGSECLESQCCVAGGDKGLQCYKKNDDYAACAPSCEVGVHEPEENGHWDETGTFIKDAWSCEKVGKRSKPGCDTYTDKKKCPKDYCMVKGDACVPRCDTYGESDGCWNSKQCMWQDDKCMDACWTFDSEETCKPGTKCYWKPEGGNCQMGWWLFNDFDSCPQDLGYMWNSSECQLDPCSMEGDDCSKTKCCSTPRGAAGMTCFEKNKDWATCMESCDRANWTCDALGEPAKFPAGCTWAGGECSQTKTCCNEGFNCAVKDETFTGCALAMQVSSWVKQSVDLPAGWEGTVVGGWRGEYAVDPVPEGGDVAGMSLFCLMVVLPDSTEVELMETAKKNKGSIFGCDASRVYDSWQTDSEGWDTGESTLVNTAVFLQVFQMVKAEGEYLKHDWLVKADPDCIFLADRLRDHMWGLRPPPNTPIYLKNNNVQGMGNNNFLGAIEVFSKKAVQIYLDNDEDCGKYLGTNSGEDGFFKGCMDALGVGFMWDHDMFKPNYDPAICTNGKYAAYHPMKYATHWQRCWDIATGKMCEGLTYDCGGDLDPPISSAGIR